MDFHFQHATPDLQPLILQWLNKDYIRMWIHGKGLQNTIRGLEIFLHHQNLNEIPEKYNNITQHWVGFHNDIPFVYLLTSNLIQDSNPYLEFSESKGPKITLDIFIGEEEYLGKGLAAQVIKQFLLEKFSKVTEVYIDPEKTNKRAIRVYEKVGFKIVGDFIAPWHPVPHYIMRLDMNNLNLQRNSN